MTFEMFIKKVQDKKKKRKEPLKLSLQHLRKELRKADFVISAGMCKWTSVPRGG